MIIFNAIWRLKICQPWRKFVSGRCRSPRKDLSYVWTAAPTSISPQSAVSKIYSRQPECVFYYGMQRIDRIQDSRFKIQDSKYKRITIALSQFFVKALDCKTYALHSNKPATCNLQPLASVAFLTTEGLPKVVAKEACNMQLDFYYIKPYLADN